VNSTHVVSEVFEDGEATIIDLRSGIYFSLNPVGSLLWSLMVDGASLDDLIGHAVASTDGGPTIASSIESFVAALVAEGLVEPVSDVDPSVRTVSSADVCPYEPPEIERFDGLQELLLLDPIHDVSAQGWPHTPPA
jgi:hypothetical protein